MKDIYLSVIIPAYNESENFDKGLLNKVSNFLRQQNFKHEVILVNDGSSDDTLLKLNKFSKKNTGFKVLDIPHGGKLAAVSAGVKQAKGEIVLFTDFDQSTPIENSLSFLDEFKKGADVVIAWRKNIKEWSFFQKLRSNIFNILVQLIILPGIKDSQCGFKAFKNAVAKQLFNSLVITQRTERGGYMGAFDAEILYLARKKGLTIKSVPVSWHYMPSKKLGLMEPIKMLMDIIKVRVEGFNGGYKILKNNGTQNLGDGLFLKGHAICILLIILLSYFSWRDTIAPGFFPMHDDLQAMRQLVMDKCFRDGQFPCRWSVDLGYGYGYPLFNFYPPLLYYFGHVIHLIGFSFIDTVKVLVVLNFLVSGITMYMLAQTFWGRWGGLVSALFYIYAPYHAVDIYVRAAMNEAWALAWFPLIFWSIYQLIATSKFKFICLLALSSAFLLLSHNPMLMIFAPGALIWTICWLIVKKAFRTVPKLILSGIWALALSAFFTLPVILEAKFVHIETLVIGYFNYLAHFADLNQLFLSRNWGFGDSRFGPVDDISFQIGHLHWILSIVAVILSLVLYKKQKRISIMIIIIFLLTYFYTFLSHQRSSFIWLSIKQLEFLQFPWRFLTLSIFGTSFLAGSIVLFSSFIKSLKLKVIFLLVFIFFIIFSYQEYFKWRDHWPWVNDAHKFQGELWRLQITSGIFDYLPKDAPLPPANPPNGDAEILQGRGEIKTIFKNSIKQEYEIESHDYITLRINTFYFPGWKYFINNQEIKINLEDDKELGRPIIRLPSGDYKLLAKFTDTPTRATGNMVSLIAWSALVFIFFIKVFHKRLKKEFVKKTL